MGNILSGFKIKEKMKGTSFVSKEVLFSGVSDSDTIEKTQRLPDISGISGASDTTNPSAQNTVPASEPSSAPAKPQMIENPLPVPKRHKKPMLDFDIDVLTGKDFFDIKVADTDDYDI